MGRAAVADSSPCSAESSFRELDDVFLQTQTRIWLGEVLKTRLDEDVHISDLLQDGEILFGVSKAVWNLLLAKCLELRHLKHKNGPFGSRKITGRYRPYSNVDSFLKVCKILGLGGIDLFSPSDVVEKRDIRKVCICIRALSKKVRSKQLSVPDFDVVMYSVAMPTDMVGGIRRSLESSRCTSSSSYSTFKDLQKKLRQKKSYASSDRDDESSSEDSDEAESRYMGENSFSPTGKLDDYDHGVNSDLEDLSEAYSTGERHKRRQCVVESDVECQHMEDSKPGVCRSTCLSKSLESFSDENIKKHHQLNNHRNGTVVIPDIDFAHENDSSVVEDSSSINVGESDYISDYLAFSDLMVHANDGSSSVILNGENNMFDFFLNADSRGLTSDKNGNGSQKKFSDDEEMEVSSTTSMSSVLGRMLNYDFDDSFDVDENSTSNVYSYGSTESMEEKNYKDAFVSSENQQTEMLETQLSTRQFDSQEARFNIASTKSNMSSSSFPPSQNESLANVQSPIGGSCDSHPKEPGNDFPSENGCKFVVDNNQETPICEHFGSDVLGVSTDHVKLSGNNDSAELSEKSNSGSQGTDLVVVSDDSENHSSTIQENECKTSIEDKPWLPVEATNSAREDEHVAYKVEDESICSAAENGSEDKRKHSVDVRAENITDEAEGTTPAIPSWHHGRRPLLKTVIKGTAIAGVLFLLIHISGNNANETKRRNRAPIFKESKLSSKKQPIGSREKGRYPAGKLKL